MFKILGNIAIGAWKTALPTSGAGFLQQTRNTLIFKRRFPPELHKTGRPPRRLKRRNYVYDLIEDTDLRPSKTIDVILMDYVEGVGLRGEMVNLSCNFARNKLLVPRLAVYASPENILKYKRKDDEIVKDVYSSMYSTKTVKCLQHIVLLLVMSMDSPWTIEPRHVKTAARQAGITLTEESIKLPDKPVTGPDQELEGKVFISKIKINNQEEAMLRCQLTHWTTDISKLPVPPSNELPHIPVFPEDEELLAALPAPTDPENKWGRHIIITRK